MPKILEMAFKRRRPERFLITWDDGTEGLFSPEVAVMYGFSTGKEFDDVTYTEILEEDGVRRAKDQILRYLGVRPHSRQELFLKTLKKEYLPEYIHKALDELTEIDLINDQKFTHQFIKNELLLKPCGKLLLKNKLLQKGVATEIFEPILDELYAEFPQEFVIREMAEKLANQNRHLSPQKRYEKISRRLLNKGFEWQAIRTQLSEINLNGFAEDDLD